MDIERYQRNIYRAIPEHTDQKDEILHWAIGLSEETGEVMSVLKHHYYGGEEFNTEELIKELGDVMWYTAALCTACNINMSVVAEINMEKLMHRFPDAEFDNGRSNQRHELEKKFSETELYKKLMEEAKSWL